jgi:basic amino acid/polyamine antiporter, APA family
MQKPLKQFDFVILVISLVIGMGIFSTPATVAASAGNVSIFYTVWVVGGIMALAGALVFAALGKQLPASGGFYTLFAKAYPPYIGFAINILLLIGNATSLAIVVLFGCDYFADLINLKNVQDSFGIIVGLICLTLFLGINLKGMYTSSKVLNFLFLLKLTLMLILIATLFKACNISAKQFNTAEVLNTNTTSIYKIFMVSLIPVCFTYGGYQQTLNFGNDYGKTPFFNKGIIIGIIIVIALYLLLNVAYIKAYTFNGLQNAKAIGAGLFEVWFGKLGSKTFDLLVVFSVMAYSNVILMSNPRIMQAMAQDGLLPKIFNTSHKKTGALSAGLICFYIITIVVLIVGKQVDKIMGFTMFVDSLGMIGSVAALFILGNKKIISATTGTKILAALFIVFYLLVIGGVIFSNYKNALLAIILLFITGCIGLLIYKKSRNNLR